MPKRVRIGHAYFDVKTDPSTALDLAARDLAGESDGNRLALKVNTAYPVATQQETLLHEILHMCLYVTGTDTQLDDDVEERVIRPMAMALFGVLRDNPKLVTYLLNKE